VAFSATVIIRRYVVDSVIHTVGKTVESHFQSNSEMLTFSPLRRYPTHWLTQPMSMCESDAAVPSDYDVICSLIVTAAGDGVAYWWIYCLLLVVVVA